MKDKLNLDTQVAEKRHYYAHVGERPDRTCCSVR